MDERMKQFVFEIMGKSHEIVTEAMGTLAGVDKKSLLYLLESMSRILERFEKFVTSLRDSED